MSGQYTTLARPAVAGSSSIVWIIAGLIALGPLSTDFYVPTLPTIGEYFSASMAEVQWTLSAYVAALGFWQLVAGPFADRFGRLPVVLGGLVTYGTGALACSLSSSLDALVLGRILQGIGVCSVLVGARGIVRDVFAPQDGARVFATAGTIMCAAPLLSPLLGATLLGWAGWRSLFVVLIGVSITMAVVIFTRLGETNLHRSERSLRPAAVISTYVRVLANPGFRAYALTWACSYGGLFAFVSGAAFVLTDVYGLAPQALALAFSVKVCGYLVGTVACRMLVARRGLQATARIGAMLQVGAGALMLVLALAGTGHVADLVAPMVLYVFAHGLLYPTAQAGLMAEFPADAGSAAALGGALSMLVASGVGRVVGLGYDGTALSMVLTIAAMSAGTGYAVLVLVARDGAISR